jgi:hypothetical protein
MRFPPSDVKTYHIIFPCPFKNKAPSRIVYILHIATLTSFGLYLNFAYKNSYQAQSLLQKGLVRCKSGSKFTKTTEKQTGLGVNIIKTIAKNSRAVIEFSRERSAEGVQHRDNLWG